MIERENAIGGGVELPAQLFDNGYTLEERGALAAIYGICGQRAGQITYRSLGRRIGVRERRVSALVKRLGIIECVPDSTDRRLLEIRICADTDTGYVSVSRYIMSDMRLSLAELGLLCTLYKLPRDWSFTCAGLCSRENTRLVPDRYDKVAALLKSLMDKGYVVRTDRSGDPDNMGRTLRLYQYPRSGNGDIVLDRHTAAASDTVLPDAEVQDGPVLIDRYGEIDTAPVRRAAALLEPQKDLLVAEAAATGTYGAADSTYGAATGTYGMAADSTYGMAASGGAADKEQDHGLEEEVFRIAGIDHPDRADHTIVRKWESAGYDIRTIIEACRIAARKARAGTLKKSPLAYADGILRRSAEKMIQTGDKEGEIREVRPTPGSVGEVRPAPAVEGRSKAYPEGIRKAADDDIDAAYRAIVDNTLRPPTKKNAFHNFQERDYDADALVDLLWGYTVPEGHALRVLKGGDDRC